MRVGFFGDGPWSHNAFKKILNEFTISFVCTRFDPGDKKLIQLASENNIPHFCYENINSSECLSEIKSFNSDIFVSLAFNQIFKKDLINIPKFGSINCHAGKLPKYRGRNILNWVLINDEKEFGITVHYIDEGIDTGDIIEQQCFPINDSDTYKTILKVAHYECANVLISSLKKIEDGTVKRIKQSDFNNLNQGFYCVGRVEGDEIIEWNNNSREIFNFIRAITEPGPNARSSLNGKEIQIISSEIPENSPIYKGVPGSVIGLGKDYLLVKTKDSFIKVLKYHYEGKIKIGDRFC